MTLEELTQSFELLQKSHDNLLANTATLAKTVTELKQQQNNGQTILNSVLRTVADGRPLTVDQLRESHHIVTSEKVNQIFNKAVEMGVLKRVDEIANNCAVLVQEFDSRGIELHRASEFLMSEVGEEYKSLFLAKKIGDRVALTKDGTLRSTFVVQDIFEIQEQVEKKLEG